MNPGYITFLLLLIIMILYICGWKEQIFHKSAVKFDVVFMASWLIALHFHISLTEHIQVNLQYVCLILLTWWIVWHKKNVFEIVQVMTVGLLLGALYVLLNQLYYMEPIFAKMESYLLTTLILGLTVVISVREPIVQIAVITIGLFLGDLFYVYLKQGHLPTLLGEWTMFDQWWLIFLFSRLISEGLLFVWKGCKLFFRF